MRQNFPKQKRTVCNFQVCLVLLQHLLHSNTRLVSFEVLNCNFKAELFDVGMLCVRRTVGQNGDFADIRGYLKGTKCCRGSWQLVLTYERDKSNGSQKALKLLYSGGLIL